MPVKPRARVHATLAVAVVLGVTTVQAAAPAASPAVASPSLLEPVPAADTGTLEVLAAPREPVLDRQTTELQVDVLVRNRSDEEAPSATIELGLDPQALTSVEELDGGFPEHPDELGEHTLGATAPGDEQRATIAVARDRLPFTEATPTGVYLLQAEAAGARVTVPIIWQGTEAQTAADSAARASASVNLGTIVPVVLPDAVTTLPTRGQLDELVPAWNDLLDEARAADATLAIDPRVPASIRAYGANAPDAARAFLARLEASQLQSFLLQFADADPAAQAALGFDTLLQPTNLDFVSRFGDFTDAAQDDDRDAPNSTPTTEPETSSTGDAGTEAGASAAEAVEDDEAGAGDDPSLPKSEELTAWSERERVAWPAEGTVDAATLELLQRDGIESFVLSSDNVDRASGGPRVRLEQGSALVGDAALAEAARTALSGETEIERGSGFAEIAAQLLLTAQSDRVSAGSKDVLLGLDRDGVANGVDPAKLLQRIEGLEWVRTAPVASLAEGTALLAPVEPAEERVELLGSAVSRESSVNELGAVLAQPEYLSGYQRSRLLNLFATRYAAPGAGFGDLAADYRARDAELLQGVRVISTEHTQLVGGSTRIPLQLHNSLPFEAVVDVDAVPASAALAVTEASLERIRIQPEGNESVLVPVTSRVSSGESGLVVEIRAASSDLTVFTGTLPISIRSGFEAVALGVLGALAALLLGFGIWRSVRRRRDRSR